MSERAPGNGADLSIVSVSFHSEGHLRVNGDYLRALNPEARVTWYVVNNAEEALDLPESPFIAIPGATKLERNKGGASYHHAEGLSIAMKRRFPTRFLLVLDPDFYLVRRNWIREITRHMVECNLSFIGSTWHPSQPEKYRYFPSIHCMFVDLHRVDVSSFSMMPDMDRVPFRKKVADRLPQGSLLCRTLRVGTSRDTGYPVFRRFSDNGSDRHECFTASYNPPRDLALLLSHLLPDSLALVPRRKGYFCGDRFLHRLGCPRPWEEFYWRGEPVAFHFRSYLKGGTTEGELAEAGALLRHFAGPDLTGFPQASGRIGS